MDVVDKELAYKQTVEQMERVKKEVGRSIVGQRDVIETLLWTILAGGHALLEGLPGLGKTMLVRTLSEVMELRFSRIQFTPDLMPTDITGTMIMSRDGNEPFTFHKGPLFHHLVLADEINRSTPKTQSALLEAMGEQTVTVVGETMRLEEPFFVLATQNPIDLEGTYPLPEAQMDRFMCKILVSHPSTEELKEIIRRTTGTEEVILHPIMDRSDLIHAQRLVKDIIVSDEVLDFAVSLIESTHPDLDGSSELVKRYIEYGSGPRGLQNLIRMAKARALLSGRYHVSIGDIKQVALPVLRHRIALNFEGEAGNVKVDDILMDLLERRLGS